MVVADGIRPYWILRWVQGSKAPHHDQLYHRLLPHVVLGCRSCRLLPRLRYQKRFRNNVIEMLNGVSNKYANPDKDIDLAKRRQVISPRSKHYLRSRPPKRSLSLSRIACTPGGLPSYMLSRSSRRGCSWS